jgi:repressor of nif and glnA expression
MKFKTLNQKYIQKDKRYYLLKNIQDKSFYRYFRYGGQLVSNPLKKEFKKLSSSKRRRIVRDWINNKNWDKAFNTFRFNISYDREIL